MVCSQETFLNQLIRVFKNQVHLQRISLYPSLIAEKRSKDQKTKRPREGQTDESITPSLGFDRCQALSPSNPELTERLDCILANSISVSCLDFSMYNTSQAVSALHAQTKSSPNALTLSNIPNQKSSANLYTVGPQVKRQSVNEIQKRERKKERGKRKGGR